MEVGQVGFHKEKEVRKMHVTKRINAILNRLNKTKRTETPNLRAEREQRDRAEREDKKRLLREQKEREKAEEKKRQEEAEMRCDINESLNLRIRIDIFKPFKIKNKYIFVLGATRHCSANPV